MLEMPSGTGKTISLLSLIVAYMKVSVTLTDNNIITKRQPIFCCMDLPSDANVFREVKIAKI